MGLDPKGAPSAQGHVDNVFPLASGYVKKEKASRRSIWDWRLGIGVARTLDPLNKDLGLEP